MWLKSENLWANPLAGFDNLRTEDKTLFMANKSVSLVCWEDEAMESCRFINSLNMELRSSLELGCSPASTAISDSTSLLDTDGSDFFEAILKLREENTI